MLVCSACALLAYRVLEPFLRSILWSILAGAFLFPFKKHLTSRARDYLEQLDFDSHLLFYGLVVLLPLRTIDRTIESMGQLYMKNCNQLLFILILLPSIELLQTGVIYHWIITIVTDSVAMFISIVHLLDSPWVTAIVIGYLIAVLTIYEQSPLVTSLLNFFAVPVWFILLVYLSQFLPPAYRLTVVVLAIVLTVVGLAVDLRERFHQNRASKLTCESSKTTSDNGGILLAPETEQRRSSILAALTNVTSRLTAFFKPKEEVTSSAPSASSTPYFALVFWSLLAIKVHQFYWYLILIPCLVIIYKQVKAVLIILYHYLLAQERVQSVIKQVLNFLEKR